MRSPRRSMRLLLFIGALNTGGAQHQYAQLAVGLASRGHDVFVTTVFPGGQNWRALDNNDHVRLATLYDHISKNVLRRGIQLSLAARRLRHFIQRNRVDLVYSSLYLSNFMAWMALRGIQNTSLIWGIRASKQSLGWKRAVPFHLCKWLSPSVPLLISNSVEGESYHRDAGYRNPRSVVIPNGFDIDRYKPDCGLRERQRAEWGIAETDFLIGIVGRLDPVKDHPTFLKAAALMTKKQKNVCFVCVGAGPAKYKQELEVLGESLGLQKRVQWTGHGDDMISAYNAFDVATSSSYAEGFSNVIGEAMACGTPCVVTDVGDSALIVGETGEIVSPRNPKALAAGWQKLIELGSTGRTSLGQGARRRIEANFSLPVIIARYESLFYQELHK